MAKKLVDKTKVYVYPVNGVEYYVGAYNWENALYLFNRCFALSEYSLHTYGYVYKGDRRVRDVIRGDRGQVYKRTGVGEWEKVERTDETE